MGVVLMGVVGVYHLSAQVTMAQTRARAVITARTPVQQRNVVSASPRVYFEISDTASALCER